MNREDVIRMAREAGCLITGNDDNPVSVYHGQPITNLLERFAALVAAEEREACAKVCDEQIERWVDDRARYCASDCAAAIRSRGAA